MPTSCRFFLRRTFLHLILQSDSAMNGDAKTPNGSANGFLELSFEYLVAKDTLKWITITSDQVLLPPANEVTVFVCKELLAVCPESVCSHHEW